MRARRVSMLCLVVAVAGGSALLAQGLPTDRLPTSVIYPRAGISTAPGSSWFDTKKGLETASKSKIISIDELRHQAPGDAVREYERACAARRKGKRDEVIAHLEKAIQIDPLYLDARNDLGAEYVEEGQVPLALQQFERAARDYPHAHLAFLNLAITYASQNQLHEAEHAARQAAELDRSSIRAKMVLGLVLVLNERFTDEALHALRGAEPEFPNARVLRARVLAARGNIQAAKTELQGFLADSPKDAVGRSIASAWLQQMDEPSNSLSSVR